MVREPTHSEENRRNNEVGNSEADEGSWVQSKSNGRDKVSPVNQRKWQKGEGKRPRSSVRTSTPARHDEPIYRPMRFGHHARDGVEGRIKV